VEKGAKMKRAEVAVRFWEDGSVTMEFEGALKTSDVFLVRAKVLREYRKWKREKAKEKKDE